MKRRDLVVVLAFAFAAVMVAASAPLHVAFIRWAAGTNRPPDSECVVIERGVLLDTLSLIVAPGDEPARTDGALHNYTRMECNGVVFLLRSDQE